MNIPTSRLLPRISKFPITASRSASRCSVFHSPGSKSVFLIFPRSFSTMPPKKQSKQNGDNTNGETVSPDAHQYQSGSTTHRKEDEWKHREPYRIHSDDEEFDVKWRGQCHCGKVQYQLSRDKPLASKYCHCSTCQRLHGVRLPFLPKPCPS
jgi:hypothetical protein